MRVSHNLEEMEVSMGEILIYCSVMILVYLIVTDISDKL